jgi:DnaA N-terminal domain
VRERLRAAGEADLAAWGQVWGLVRESVGESTFEIWLAPLELVAVDLEGTLVVCAPAAMVGWVASRFGRVLDGAARHAGRPLRVAGEVELRAAESLAPAAAGAGAARAGFSADARLGRRAGSAGDVADIRTGLSEVETSHRLAAGLADQPGRKPTYPSPYPSSYPDVYNQTKEVSR